MNSKNKHPVNNDKIGTKSILLAYDTSKYVIEVILVASSSSS
jgi:hypothetical protein